MEEYLEIPIGFYKMTLISQSDYVCVARESESSGLLSDDPDPDRTMIMRLFSLSAGETIQATGT